MGTMSRTFGSAAVVLAILLAPSLTGRGVHGQDPVPPTPGPPVPDPTPGPTPDPDPPSPQPPTLSLPEKIEADPGQFIRVPATTNGRFVKWQAVDPGLNLFPVELLKDTRTAVVTAIVPGDYRLLAYTAIADVPSDAAQCVISIRGPRPPPTPTPPGPGPGPGPTPDPTPDPTPGPVQGKITRVLLLWETSAALTRQQVSVINSTAVRDRLDQVCPVESGVPAWKFWDKDIVATKATPAWQAAMTQAKARMSTLPQVFLFTDKGAMDAVPMPETEAEFLALLDKYKGA